MTTNLPYSFFDKDASDVAAMHSAIIDAITRALTQGDIAIGADESSAGHVANALDTLGHIGDAYKDYGAMVTPVHTWGDGGYTIGMRIEYHAKPIIVFIANSLHGVFIDHE